MWGRLLKRLYYKRKVAGTALQQCWQMSLPSLNSDWREHRFLVIDCEMTSLDAAAGELLSIAWVEVECAAIKLSTARHYLLRTNVEVGQSATIHQLRDCDFDHALAPRQALLNFLSAAEGKVLVFHNAVLDLAFINRLSRRCYNAPLLLPCVDTLLQEEKLLKRTGQLVQPGDLRLQACRERYGLPHFDGHNALQDAQATAELFLAQMAKRSRGKHFSVSRVM